MRRGGEQYNNGSWGSRLAAAGPAGISIYKKQLHHHAQNMLQRCSKFWERDGRSLGMGFSSLLAALPHFHHLPSPLFSSSVSHSLEAPEVLKRSSNNNSETDEEWCTLQFHFSDNLCAGLQLVGCLWLAFLVWISQQLVNCSL